MFQTLLKVVRVFKNIFFLKEPVLGVTAIRLMGFERFFLFLLNLLIPYGLVARYILLKTAAKKPVWVPFMLESGFLHSALRMITPEERTLISKVYAANRKNSKYQPLIDGYVKLGNLISSEKCAEVVAYLKNEKGFLSQVPMHCDGNLYSYKQAEKLSTHHGRYFSFSPTTSLKNSVIAGLVENEHVKYMVDSCLGSTAELYSVNTFIVFPGETLDHYVMKMHRDYDDFNFLAFFVYWSSVTAENGATIFVPKTNLNSDKGLLEHKVYLEGEPGEVFALDSFGYHSGNSSVKTPRVVTWFRYGLRNNLAAVQDGWPLYKVTPGSPHKF